MSIHFTIPFTQRGVVIQRPIKGGFGGKQTLLPRINSWNEATMVSSPVYTSADYAGGEGELLGPYPIDVKELAPAADLSDRELWDLLLLNLVTNAELVARCESEIARRHDLGVTDVDHAVRTYGAAELEPRPGGQWPSSDALLGMAQDAAERRLDMSMFFDEEEEQERLAEEDRYEQIYAEQHANGGVCGSGNCENLDCYADAFERRYGKDPVSPAEVATGVIEPLPWSQHPDNPDNYPSAESVSIVRIPADDSQPCELLEVAENDWRNMVKERLGSYFDEGVYDHDATICVHDSGAVNGHPINLRASRYAFEQSKAAERQPTGSPWPYGLHGDAYLVGMSNGAIQKRPPKRLLTLFGVARRDLEDGVGL